MNLLSAKLLSHKSFFAKNDLFIAEEKNVLQSHNSPLIRFFAGNWLFVYTYAALVKIPVTFSFHNVIHRK